MQDRYAPRLLVDDALWRDLSRGGRRHVEENLSRDALARDRDRPRVLARIDPCEDTLSQQVVTRLQAACRGWHDRRHLHDDERRQQTYPSHMVRWCCCCMSVT